MEAARGRLRAAFPDVRFSSEAETTPIGMRRRAPFANQVAEFTSPLTPGEVERELKRIEREAGRKPEEKTLEIVRIDLDLLSAGGRVLKPADWTRDYVVQGVSELYDSVKK